jgi:hypothetical protein
MSVSGMGLDANPALAKPSRYSIEGEASVGKIV